MKKSKNEYKRFVAWDGEGGEIDGVPRYVLLANSNGDNLYNANGLDTKTCLDFLLSADTKRSIHVIYSGGYDTNMMVRDLPKQKLQKLWEGETVKFQKYNLTYVPKKFFRVSSGGKTITIWDVFGFFQTSFAKAVREWLGAVPELEIVEHGKKLRKNLLRQNKEYIIKYNATECILLKTLMEKLHEALSNADIRISRWHGPGAIASALLRKHTRIQRAPVWVEELSYAAYFGGRTETFAVGTHLGPTYRYDIRSAYPWAMSELKNIDHHSWRTVKRFVPDAVGMYLVQWRPQGNTRIYPFPFRDKNGRLSYPRAGETWVWHYEVQAALDCGFNFKILDGVVANTTSEKPYEWVLELYRERAQLREQNNSAHKALKLGLNSLYGKTAQSVGHNVTATNKPRYHNPVVAGMITSAVRARMLYAMMQAPDDILYCATDGLVSRSALDLPIGEQLGEWEFGLWDGACVIMSGIYGRLLNGVWTWNYRGLEEGIISYDVLRKKWRAGERIIHSSTRRFVGMGLALHLSNMDLWCKFVDFPKKIIINGHGEYKRIFYIDGKEKRVNFWNRIYPNYPIANPCKRSYPYTPAWGIIVEKIKQFLASDNPEIALNLLDED